MRVLFQGWLYIISKFLQPRRSHGLSLHWKDFNSVNFFFLNFRLWKFWEIVLRELKYSVSQILFNNFCAVSLKKNPLNCKKPTAQGDSWFHLFSALDRPCNIFPKSSSVCSLFFSNVPSGILQFAAGEVTGFSTLVRALSHWQERLFLISYCIAQSLYFLFFWAGFRLEVFLSQLLEIGGHRTIPPCLPSPFLAIDDTIIE